MSRNTSITLGSPFEDFVAAQLESGRYRSAREVARAGLRLLEDAETRMHRLRHLLAEGEKSGFADYSSRHWSTRWIVKSADDRLPPVPTGGG